ncbi:MAG: rhodanese-like domain-containing protein [Gammaproteobacteria bacterium]
MAGKPKFEMPEGDYAGDVTCKQAWQAIEENSQALLIDVRTQVEWQLIGQPDLSSLNTEPVYVQWVTMQGMNENFIEELQVAIRQRAADEQTPLYFMCQSGGRSKMAAMQLTALGFQQCFNVAEGFEGDLDEHQHRNSVSGWKLAGLPWVQS